MKGSIWKIKSKIWHSAVLMSWLSQGVQALRLVALTPLLLTRFDTSELAAWYVFSSLIFLGQLINTRVDLTFSRMVSFAHGGASDLSPIKNNRTNSREDKPNWPLIGDLLYTLSRVFIFLALFNLLCGGVIGFYGLEKIVDAAKNPNDIWTAFAVILIGNAITDSFKYQPTILRGLNYVALEARWQLLNSALSLLLGCFAILVFNNIIAVAVAMQSVPVLNILRYKYLINEIEGGVFRTLGSLSFDRRIISWAWQPFYKGLIQAVSNNAGLQIVNIFVARTCSVEVTASYLFTQRILNTFRASSVVPLTTRLPKISNLMARGEVVLAREIALKRIKWSLLLFTTVSILFYFIAGFSLKFLGSNLKVLEDLPFLLLVLVLFTKVVYMTTSTFVNSTNNVLFTRESILGLLLFASLVTFISHEYGLFGVLMLIGISQVAFLRIKPLSAMATHSEMSVKSVIKETCLSWHLFIYSALVISFLIK